MEFADKELEDFVQERVILLKGVRKLIGKGGPSEDHLKKLLLELHVLGLLHVVEESLETINRTVEAVDVDLLKLSEHKLSLQRQELFLILKFFFPFLSLKLSGLVELTKASRKLWRIVFTGAKETLTTAKVIVAKGSILGVRRWRVERL